jgi:ssDNA thymidine ADP-ribosyltransferase DarT-like protein
MAGRSTSSALTAGEGMKRADVTELHYIAAIANVSSILQHGILSHTLAAELAHDSVAMPEIQERRRNKLIPGAGMLHDYANLYFDAHNPMLSRCRQRNNEICVLRVDPAALDLPAVIVTDRNAAADWASFWPLNDGLERIDRGRVFARYWVHPDDLYEERRHKAEKCAEVLVPDRIDPQLVNGAYVANQTAFVSFQNLNTGLRVQIRSDMFF